jgi:5-dehydro-2-deoxygluconokinase
MDLSARLARGPILVIGRAGMDLYADPPGAEIETATRFEACLGGSSANIAAGVARQGGAAALVTCVSDDAVGRFALAALDRFGIDRRHVRSVAGEARTSLAVVETRAPSCQSVIYRNHAADFAMERADVAGLDYAGAGAVVTTGTVFAAEPSRGAAFHAFELARAAGAPLIFDIDHRPYSWASPAEAAAVLTRAARLSDVVIGNVEEFDFTAGAPGAGLALAQGLAREGAAIVVYKMGPEGAITLTPEAEVRTGVYPVAAIKPTGAGDAFLAGFVMALLHGRPLREAVLRGSATASIVVSRVGCAPAMPTTPELEAFLATHPGPTQPKDADAHSAV